MQHKFRSQNEHENEHENEQEQEEQDDDDNSDGNNPPLSTIMDSITFKSSYVPPVCNVAVGKIRPSKSTKERDEIHLTPIHSHYMMRPGFKHIDDLDVKDGKDNDFKEMEEEEGNGLEKVQYKKKESDRTVNARKTSFGHRKKQIEEEDYINLKIVTNPHPSSKLLSTSTASVNFDHTSPYIKTLNYLEELNLKKLHENGESYDAISPSTISTLESALQKIISSFVEGEGPINFSVMLSVIDYVDEDVIMFAMRTVGVLVKGNWVINSDLTPYLPDEKLVRDCMIGVFRERGELDKGSLEVAVDKVGVRKDVIERMLKEIAVKKGKVWRCKLEDDVEFGNMYPVVEEEEEKEWNEGRGEVCKEYLEEYERLVLIEAQK
ncbi:hypothetical protein TrVE_jg2503 [Triparma verrucosa]|uniref:DNA-directed RNA polymerase III subunit RPC5 n=1 Tax=Triparma verrucosa TaxID=1606542 RepID=A0A9W7BZU4_9STRA|nr:hypothetical protein TrVE_jg2503 [Triparma verrucosa]